VPAGRNFVDVYEEHVWDIYGYLAYRLSSRVDAEDLTQLTFERAFGAWNQFDEARASVRTWLVAIARNALIDHRRRDHSRGRTVVLDQQAEAAFVEQQGPEETHLGLSPELDAALLRLSPRERDALALRFGADLRGAEIAVLLEISEANAHQILSRALRKLRDMLAVDEPGPRPNVSQASRTSPPTSRAGQSRQARLPQPRGTQTHNKLPPRGVGAPDA